MPRLLVVGAPPAGADVMIVPDLAAAARAAAAGEGHALWLAVVRDFNDAVAAATLACLLPGAWTRLFAPLA